MGELTNVILARQQLKESKRQADQQLALQMLQMEIGQERFDLTIQANLLDKQLIRAEKKYDEIFGEIETYKDDYHELTGQIYKVSEENKSQGAIDVLRDISTPVIENLDSLLNEVNLDTQNLREQKVDITKQMSQANLISDFYKGVGHDPDAGDPNQWDIEDFSEKELTEYMAKYPELVDADQAAFYEGVKTRGAANLLQNISALNTVLNQAKTAQLTASMKQLDYDVKQENMPAAQIEQDISTIDKGVHSMLQSQANVLNSNLLSPAIQASIEFAASQTPSDPEGDPDLEAVKEDQLMLIGSQISGFPADSQDEDVRGENLQLGKALVLGNVNYVNSIKGHLAGTGDLDYVGYVNALEEIQMYGENRRRQMEAGEITTDQYLAYKNQLERITGTNLNQFSSDMNLVMQSVDRVKDKGRILAIAGMKDQYVEYEPSIDYEVPEDYVSPITLEAAEAAAMKQSLSNIVLPDSTMILPDSTTELPDTSAILIDDPLRGGRGAEADPKYAGFISKGEPYFDPESGEWLYEEPMFNLAGGFLPVPNPYAFRDRPVSGQDLRGIEPIYDEDGKIIGFTPPTDYAPPSTLRPPADEVIKLLEQFQEKE